LDKVILPIRGYGLWSTMQGFLALEEDMTTVAGIGFFAHKETPGLGGEIDNPNWKQNWVGKEVYESGELALEVIKGSVDPDNPNAEHRVDGLAGATLTTRGVDNLIQFWLGEYGFKDFLTNLKEGRA
ncbi:MAG: NADH:ubiquinone reductase (Na(+)-transporting) subunit C, partial [Pseudomonadales bacterium]